MVDININYINKQISYGIFPDMYPSLDFRKKHQELIKDYKMELNIYKGACHKEVNSYLRTGKVILQKGCLSPWHLNNLELIAQKNDQYGLSVASKIKLIAQRMQELYDKVIPLDYDIIVYRGVKRGIIGRNIFTGKCVRTFFEPDTYSCKKENLIDIPLFNQYKMGNNPEDYILETLGFVSTTTDIDVAESFARISNDEYDTVLALKLPAGTKFIMLGLDDYEHEILLFPRHCTFVVNNSIQYMYKTYYAGSFCNELNKWGPLEYQNK